ncbi:MAG: 4a-hydroxytetrahydrobiopterin dehydratase [Nanoarchaeota archaeon]|nr:4a-hydroxytetrahydrobiopterin dehydratase [Nanoarchaeota archaeon]
MELLSISQINAHLESLPDWNLEDNGKSVIKIFEFEDFSKAVNFINKITEIAEREKHHPELRLYDYNKLEIKFTTHSVNGLTKRDFELASEINKILT